MREVLASFRRRHHRLTVLAVLAGLALSIVVGVAAASPAQALPLDTSWSTQLMPETPVPTAQVKSISCPVPSSCFAVGYNQAPQARTDTLVERGSGATWSRMTTPDAVGQTFTQLGGISCASIRFCVAVGWAEPVEGLPVAFAITWTGTTWTRIRPAFNTRAASESSRLTAVSCAAVNRCTAVGAAGQDSTPLIEEWNGTSWRIASATAPTKAEAVRLDSVDCPTVSYCVAGGQTQVQGQITALTEQGGNGRYTYRQPVGPSDLLGMSCVRASSCTAVGTSHLHVPYAYFWNGRSWARAGVPGPKAYERNLTAVSCTSATACTASGYSFASSQRKNARPYFVVRSGNSWRTIYTGTRADVNGQLSSIDCHAATCVAGGQTNTHLLFGALTAARTGIALPAKPVGSRGDSVADVSCVSGGFCAAVGPGPHSWTRTADAQPWLLAHAAGASGTTLRSVSCVSPSFCAAAGWLKATTYPYSTGSVVEFWNGKTWSLTAAPDVGAATVECASSTSCLAAGDRGTDFWNGTTWRAAPLALPGGTSSVDLRAVSCAGPTYCLGLGYTDKFSAAAEEWDGTVWTLVAAPTDTANVSCPAVRDCVSVGEGTVGADTRTEQWNGTAWSYSDGPPDPGLAAYPDAAVTDLSCSSTTSCTAVVDAYSDLRDCPETYDQPCDTPVVAHWQGTTWTDALLPVPASAVSSDTAPRAVSCTPDGSCTWVGNALTTPVSGTRPA